MSAFAVNELQTALAAEHAAVYLYGALGGATSQSSAPALYATLTENYRDHRRRRDNLQAQIRSMGGTPAAAAAVYDVPDDLSSGRRVRAAALDIERGVSATYANLVGATVADSRADALRSLASSALSELRVGGEPTAFPGIAELTVR